MHAAIKIHMQRKGKKECVSQKHFNHSLKLLMSFLSNAFNVMKRNSDIKLTELLFAIINKIPQ